MSQIKPVPPETARTSKILIGVGIVLTGLSLFQSWTIHSLKSEQSTIDRFHHLWYWKLDTTWNANTWLGVRTQQFPDDAWIQQEIIAEVKPDFVVETGTFYGGSALIWAMVLSQVNPDGRVITVDITDRQEIDGKMVLKLEKAEKFPIWKERVDFIMGSSTDPKVVAEVEERVKGKRVVVILDSVHTKDHVLAELRAYSPLVPVGSYLIVQDTNLGGHPVFPEAAPGSMDAVEEFLKSNNQFVADRSRERLLLTCAPKGYLKRVR
jgi:cephalosporin hydroxylase